MEIIIPAKVKFIIKRIYEHGYEAFIVGGCVRDSILGNKPNDYDITTNAKPQDIIRIFDGYKILDNGIKHGTVGVVIEDEVYEITTYRIESEYEDNRRPKNVEFTSNLLKDLKRRDFTINAMAYNEKVGLIDKFDGIKDLHSKTIRTVGNPDDRFIEDGLRIIRAIRFSCKLGFEIEEETLSSIYKNVSIISKISVERITEEFTKAILSEYTDNITILIKSKILQYLDIYCYLDEYDYNMIENNISILKECPHNLEERLIMLEYLIINEKIKSINEDTKRIQFYKENMQGQSIFNKLRYSNKVTNVCNELIQVMILDEESLDRVKIKKILNKIGVEDFIRLIKLKKIFYKNYLFKQFKTDINEKNNILNNQISIVNDINSNRECYTIKSLDIDGNDLRDLGYVGMEIGKILNFLLDEVQKYPDINNKKQLIELLNKKS